MAASRSFRLHAAGLTDIGQNRSLNEDSFYFNEELRLLLVADGMGGHAAGEVASREVVSSVAEFLSRSGFEISPDTTELLAEPYDDDSTLEDLPNPAISIITAAVQHANDTIYQMNQAQGYAEGQGMGTTVVGLWMPGGSDDAVVFNVGDSRLYLCRNGRLTQWSQDHTWYQYWLDNGKVGPAPASNIVMRAMGIAQNMPVYTRLEGLRPGDLILLCSDGLTAMVPDALIEDMLRQIETAQLSATCQQLVDISNKKGGRDNITVVLARYG